MEKFNKLKSIIFVMLCTFFLTILGVSASSTGTIRTNDGWGVLLRSSASSSASKLADVPENATVTILDTNQGTGNGCGDYQWYKVSYANKTGYVCSKYIVTSGNTTPIDPNGAYEQTLRNAGFPESYWPYLKALHLKFPNWQFQALTVSTTFDRMAQEQYTLGKNLIQNPNDGWKRLDTYLYNENRFRTDFSGGGSTWFAPSMETIKYYLDPRNFLNEYDIFMFENLSFNSTYHTKSGVTSILSNTFMSGNTIDGTNKSYADVIMDSASATRTSPYFISARIIQEVGTSRTAVVSGTVAGYEGYYNYYNIDSTGSSDEMTNVRNGLARAVREGWNTEQAAITGGANIIAQNYIHVGQNTLYNQKFDMTNFWHQYQQNIEAPLHEGYKMKKTYLDNISGYQSSNFVFRIPVYQSMPTNVMNKPRDGSPINALRDLKVDNTTVSGFNRDKKSYEVYVSGNKNSVNISATPHVSSASVSGTGSVSLSNTETTKEVKVTAQNGNVNTYTIKIIKDVNTETKEPTVTDIMPNIGVKYNNTQISGIKIGTDVSSLINNVKKQNANASITIKDVNGTTKTSGKFGTGYKVTINSGGTNKTYDVIIYGDANGDGDITILDLLRVQKIILGSANLSGVYKTASDTNKDGKVTILDLLKVQNDILGRSKITQ